MKLAFAAMTMAIVAPMTVATELETAMGRLLKTVDTINDQGGKCNISYLALL